MDLALNFLKENLWSIRSDRLFGAGDPDSCQMKSGQVHGVDFTEPGSLSVNPVPSSGEPTHGTSVAAIIGARRETQFGHEGVAQSVRMMSLKVFPSQIDHYASSVSHAIHFAVDHGAQVINCSFFLYSDSSKIMDAFQYAFEKGVLVVAAAGNEDADLSVKNGLPATFDFPNILTVGAIGRSLLDHLIDQSNYGKKVDLAAPGAKPLLPGVTHNHGFSSSFAAAYVSGACALVWQRLASRSYSRKVMAYRVKEALLEHARCVSPTIATGVEERRIKFWGEGNRVLDLGFLA